ncbi:MAG: hypothetical protein IKD69_08425 [Solobacterium sp.]|nr:hypothetical protein [Solobacterium sp.]
MWLLFGSAAVITALFNYFAWTRGKETEYYRFASISLTALTMCAFYSDGARRVPGESWGTLMDIMPTMSPVLWGCVAASILINGITLFTKKKQAGA